MYLNSDGVDSYRWREQQSGVLTQHFDVRPYTSLQSGSVRFYLVVYCVCRVLTAPTIPVLPSIVTSVSVATDLLIFVGIDALRIEML